jgi:rod shape determining protein RodA
MSLLNVIDVAARAPARPSRLTREDAATFVRRLDWVLLGTVGALIGVGLWAIAGITKHDVAGNESYFVARQAVFAALGTVGMLTLLFVDPVLVRRAKQPIFVGTVGLMVLVFLAGSVVRGSRRWIDLGFFQFQPSEFGKVLFVLFLAAFVADRGRRIGEWRTVLTAVGLGAIPIGLVFAQPDFGTALVYGAALTAVLFIGGARWLHLSFLAVAAGLTALTLLWFLPSIGVEVLKPYQAERLTAFTDPDRDPGGATYNINQSKTAVGAGGLTGRGVDEATQTRFDYLPEHATDFVFASLAEQRGFVGAAILLLLYLLLLWRGLRIIPIAPDAFSAIVAGGIVFALLFQIFINVGMTMGIAPITGIPLPFVSVGGSSMISNLLAVGILEAIHLRGRSLAR